MSSARTTGLPSLLMKAAHCAAIADGIIKEEKLEEISNNANAKIVTSSKNVNNAPKTSGLDLIANSAHESLASVKRLPSKSATGIVKGNTAAAFKNAQNTGSAAAAPKSAMMPKITIPSTTATNRFKSQQNQPLNVTLSSSSSSGNSSNKSKKGPALRRGKWTPEEEAYANRLIQEFKSGLLPLTDGTTLRTFLSKLLNCDPMRISKKFVGSNCIGKQVFRRRTADINRLTPEQIQQSRNELSELERRFLDRVAQTNRVKSSSAGAAPSTNSIRLNTNTKHDHQSMLAEHGNIHEPTTPPWMRAPTNTYNVVNAANNSNTLNRAAAAGRALLQANNGSGGNTGSGLHNEHLLRGNSNTHDSAGLLAMAEMQRRLSRQNMMLPHNQQAQHSQHQQGGNATGGSGIVGNNGLSGAALAQIARNASAARMSTLANSVGASTGTTNNPLSALQNSASTRALEDLHRSQNSLVNMMERQSSFDALMSLDIQSLQSIDNLANLIQSGGNRNLIQQQAPKSGIKNWSMDNVQRSVGLSNHMTQNHSSFNSMAGGQSHGQQSQSALDLQNLIRSISNGTNLRGLGSKSGSTSSSNFLSSNISNASFTNPVAPANMSNFNMSALLNSNRRTESSTGLTALRMQDGLLNNMRQNSSVDDFLSLVANGDIPHQDPHLLNVPLQSVLSQQQHASSSNVNAKSAAQFLARQQILAAATAGASNNNLQDNASRSYLNTLSGQKRKAEFGEGDISIRKR